MKKTLKITISAVLTALTLVYIVFMPTIDLGVWSFTPFSHAFLFIACFISPYTAVMTYLSVLGGFIIKTGNYLIWLRAASHLFFVVFLVIYIKFFKLKSKKHIIIAAAVTAALHAVFEILAVLFGLVLGFGDIKLYGTVYYILLVVGLGTIGHSLLDYFAAFFLYKVCRIERLILGQASQKDLQEEFEDNLLKDKMRLDAETEKKKNLNIENAIAEQDQKSK